MGLTGIPPAVFMREGNAMDPRSVRTRQQLLAAFERQLETGEIAPTVSSLAREAGVSRSAFYKHFTGADEVGVAAFRAILDDFEPLGGGRANADIAPEMATAASFEELFVHLGRHRRLCSAVLIADVQVPVLAELGTTLVEHLAEAIGRVGAKPEGLDPAQAATFLVGGILGLFLAWLQDSDHDADGLASVVASMLPDWLRGTGTLDAPIRVSRTSPQERIGS
ncbi:TetR/AcrR family transcriptional regulator [Nocardia sp. NBC_01327]|uniref:TetR/AcrR family transcriptional regulator n=1 Tax=Nocardia sp. NBC_01327 TaxID=2903593 RepID=UPI002E0E4B5A|nr:TetR/AcrR family transcriptional regulator [Nocardia sp. NBC_01327]